MEEKQGEPQEKKPAHDAKLPAVPTSRVSVSIWPTGHILR